MLLQFALAPASPHPVKLPAGQPAKFALKSSDETAGAASNASFSSTDAPDAGSAEEGFAALVESLSEALSEAPPQAVKLQPAQQTSPSSDEAPTFPIPAAPVATPQANSEDPRPVRKLATPAKQSELKTPPLTIVVPGAVPLPAKPLKFGFATPEAPTESAPPAVRIEASDHPQTPLAAPPAALEIRLRFDDKATVAEPSAPTSTPESAPKLPQTPSVPAPVAVAEAEPRARGLAQQAGPAVSGAPPLTSVLTAETATPARTEARSARAPAPHPAEEPALPQTQLASASPQQALKTVAIDFTPDGARDVRLRVSDHAGDVHISMHTNDAVLTSRIGEDVHDLVGALSNAGYDAQAWAGQAGSDNSSAGGAWASSQERQNQRPYQEGARRSRRNGDSNAVPADFGTVLASPAAK